LQGSGEQVCGGANKIEARQLKVSVKIIHTDNGPEFLTNKLSSFASEEGIKLRKSPEYNTELNGLAERVQRTLLKK
jgi:transposase InsO family protein